MLDKEQIRYFEDEKHLQKPLGTVYLDEILDVRPDAERTTEKVFYFVISVTGRDLLVSSKISEDCNAWLRCITGMMLLARTEAAFLSDAERDGQLKERENSRMKGRIHFCHPDCSLRQAQQNKKESVGLRTCSI